MMTARLKGYNVELLAPPIKKPDKLEMFAGPAFRQFNERASSRTPVGSGAGEFAHTKKINALSLSFTTP
jgi:hypothetical protein